MLYTRRAIALPEYLAEKIQWWRTWLSKVGAGDLRLSSAPADDPPAASGGGSAAITSRPSVTGSHGLICGIVLMVILGSTFARAGLTPREWKLTLPARNDTFAAAPAMEWAQGENVLLSYSAAAAAEPSQDLRWEVADASNIWLSLPSENWSWALSPSQSCLPAGRYAGRIAAYKRDGTNLVFHRVAAVQSILVHAGISSKALATPLSLAQDELREWMDTTAAEIAEAVPGIVVDSIGQSIAGVCQGGLLYPDFCGVADSSARIVWVCASTGTPTEVGCTMVTPELWGKVAQFTAAPANVRASSSDISASLLPGENLTLGAAYSSGPYSGTATNIIHWAGDLQANDSGIFFATIGNYTAAHSRLFPGWISTTNFNTYAGLVDGSLRASINAEMLALLGDGEAHPFDTLGAMKRNPDVWAADIDLTCFSPSNSLQMYSGGGTLVTPQHMLLSSHWPAASTTNSSGVNGATFLFVGRDNTHHRRNVTRARQVAGDCTLALLSSPLPASITPAQIIDTNDFAALAGATFPAVGGLVGASGIIAAHVRPNRVRAVRVAWDGDTTAETIWSSRDPELPFSDTNNGSNYVGSDSSSPVVLCIAGHTVLIHTLHNAAGEGPNVATLARKIEAVMPTLGSSVYTNLSIIDLSQYPNFETQ